MCTARILRAFLRETGQYECLPFSRLSPELIRKFRAYLLGERGNSENTANRALTIIQIFVRLAIRDGLINANDNPFLGIKLTWKKREKKRLTLSDIEALSSIHLEGKEAVVRDIFLFAFYAGGLRISDALHLRRSQLSTEGKDWRLRLIMKKTGNEKSMIWPKQAVQILERYPSKGIVFQMLRADKIGTAAKELQERRTATRTMNKMLKSNRKSIRSRDTIDHISCAALFRGPRSKEGLGGI